MSTHHCLLYHIVFSVKHRKPLLRKTELRTSVWSYMAGVVKNVEGFALEVGGFEDHAHLLVRIPTKLAVADFVKKVKSNTSNHINNVQPRGFDFHWQDGYGAFTVSQSQKDQVAHYIQNQVEHHRKMSFKEEYLRFLKRHEVDYDPERLWS
ncbi:IS200/IS605 family transposase [Roseimaritima sediminicola]|uniref:IS200/IS605 family transposase n=1 Tax=Roseimaritima sediminicola TaxID=2662066 RepID=UPI0012983512|nr:IS200/IS605 family transposase [Roseimaritima sediminicola]